MLKAVLLGVWVIAVTAAATYGAVFLSQSQPQAGADLEEDLGVESFKTEMTSVPMMRNGEIIGYVIIQLAFQADRKFLEALHAEPVPYLIDSAFRVIFGTGDVDFRRLRGSDLDRLTLEIRDNANRRLGQKLIRDVLIMQLNFVRKEDIRTNWIRKEGGD